MRKKKVLIGISGLFVIVVLIITLTLTLFKSDNNVILSENDNNNNFINNSFLTLMLEQSDGTYQESLSNTWPSGNYAFNSELSRCENGGELRWDRETGIVELLSNKSDACYVYFDLYNVVTITNVSATTTTNSVTLTVIVDAGENPVATYYFSMDGGRSYQTSNTNTYTFSNLNYGTSYTFQVYAIDSEGYESNEETIEVTTDNYVNPVVNSVTTTNVTNNSITVSVNASGGTNNIQRYYYSSNGGSSYANTTSNSYTFSGLSAGQTYQIRVYVVDSNGIQSNVYNLTVQTDDTVLLADYVISQYNGTQGNNGIYYHTSSLANSAADNSYRYTGENPNNYVCFGSTASTCPSNNLYRILGVFENKDTNEKQVKLLKNQSLMTRNWSDNSGKWNTSSLKNYLNTTYLNSLGNYSNLIATVNWRYGIVSETRYMTFREMHLQEQSFTESISEKIGLMYVGDFYYTMPPEYWTEYVFYRMFNYSFWPEDSWTMTNMSSEGYAFFVDCSYYNPYQMEESYFQVNDNNYSVVPAFYLNSDVAYVSGSGTSSDPIKIN